MKVTSLLIAVALAPILGTAAFQSSNLPSTSRNSLTVVYQYIPAGFTKESWAKFRAQEEAKKTKANLGRLGPKGFKSRSFQSFQEALERGEAEHLLPVFNAKEKLAKKEIRAEDIPYMQRGGSWDNSDVKGAKNKKQWLSSDKQYADGGFKREQSVSIFGVGEGLDWTGTRSRSGPEGVMRQAPKFAKNYKPPNVNDLKSGAKEQPKKKFGWF